MIKISKDYIYLTEENDHYKASNLIVSDDVIIELDKRLHIEGDIFVAGGLTSNVEIDADGVIVISGTINAIGIQGSSIKMLGRINIAGDFLSRESCILGATNIEGTMISYGTLTLLSDCSIGEKAAFKGLIDSNYRLNVNGLLYIDGVLEAKGAISAKSCKVNNVDVSKYARFVSADYTVVMYDDMISLMIPSVGWKSFLSKEELKIASKNDNIIGNISSDILGKYDSLKNNMFNILG